MLITGVLSENIIIVIMILNKILLVFESFEINGYDTKNLVK